MTAHIGRGGALVDVELSLTDVDIHRRQLGEVNLQIPFPQRVRALIDTGAEICLINDAVADALALEETRRVPVVTVHGDAALSRRRLAAASTAQRRMSGAPRRAASAVWSSGRV